MIKSETLESKPAGVDAIDSRRLQVFLEAARNSSFASAAQVLGMVPSAVSHAIKSLEEEFQCNLFKRHGPRVTLTRAGIRLLPLAEDLLARMSHLRAEVSDLQKQSRHLRVMMPESFCSHILPKVLPDFMECFPSAQFEVMNGGHDGKAEIAALDACEVDLLISYYQYDDEQLARRELFDEHLELYVAPFHPLASVSKITWAHLIHIPLLVPDPSSEQLATQLMQRQGVTARLWLLQSMQSALELARAGQGVALLPTSSTEFAVKEGWLTQIRVAGATMRRTCSIYRSGKMDAGWSAEVFSNLIAMSLDED